MSTVLPLRQPFGAELSAMSAPFIDSRNRLLVEIGRSRLRVATSSQDGDYQQRPPTVLLTRRPRLCTADSLRCVGGYMPVTDKTRTDNLRLLSIPTLPTDWPAVRCFAHWHDRGWSYGALPPLSRAVARRSHARMTM